MRPKVLYLNLLPALDAILNARTLTEAADKANLTQPALSIALKKARAHFDDQLVVFRGSRIELTELGSALRLRVKAALQAARDALDCVLTFDPATANREVRIMANSYIEFAFIPQLLARIYAEAPQLCVKIENFKPLPSDSNLLEEVDIVLASKSFVTGAYHHAELFRDRITCLAWNEHPTLGECVSVEDWKLLRHATAAPYSLQNAPRMFSELEEQQRLMLRAQSATTLPYMIVGTDLVVNGMSRFCEPFTKILPLRLVKVIDDDSVDSALNVDVSVCWKAHRSDEPFIHWLVSLCQDIAGKH